MTRDPVGRRGVRGLDTMRRLDASTILTTILVLGLVLRVFIAGVYLPMSGFSIDIGDFTAWGQRLASIGPAHFYEAGYFSDYPPGYLYVLWLLGSIVGEGTTAALMKIPGIAADIGVAWLLFAVGRRWGGELISRPGVSGTTLGLAAATVYLFNPGTIFDSAVWGQIDSVGTLLLLATIYALGRGWTEVAAVGAVVAMLVKFQFAFLIPVVAIVGIKRHVLARSSDPARHGRRDPLRALTSLAAGTLSLMLLMLPFGMGIYAPAATDDPKCLGFLPAADPSTSLIGKFCEAASTYTGLSINAFNVWRNPLSGLGDTLHWGDDTVVGLSLGGLAVTWQQVGMLLFAAVALLALWQVARRDDLRGIVLASLLLAIAFFVLPTRVHERYLFPALALGALLILSGRTWPWIYGALSLSFFANIYWVYTEDWSFAGGIMNPGANGAPMPQDAFLSSTLLTDWGIWLLALMIVVVLAIVAWRSLRLGLSQREADGVVERADASAGAAVAAHAPASASTPAELGWLAPNPADAYLREPSRRLDRRDALILLGLVVFALVFRLWRLDVPRSQHFDEVYHARSAAEWLSAWQNGWDRDVYEWTHPMLAKYLIAAGIAVADPNGLIGMQPLDAPASSLAVAPQRSSRGWDRSIAFTADGGPDIVASDARSGEELGRWDAGGPIATLAYDPEAPRLLVGRADGGTVETFELAGMLASPDGRAPPAGPSIESGLEVVSQVVVPDAAADPLLLRGPDGIAVVERESDTVTATTEGAFGGIAYVQGVEANDTDWVVVTDQERNAVLYLDSSSLEPRDEAATNVVAAPLIGPLLVRGSGDDQLLLALTAGLDATEEHPATVGGVAVIDADGDSNSRCSGDPCVVGLVPLPGTPALIGHQDVAGLVYVAGTTPAGASEVWALEPHMEARGDGTIGLAAFDATQLPGTPLGMDFDVTSTGQGDDHGQLVVSAVDTDGDARLVRIDAGSNAFAWRLAGVLFGAGLVGLIYLLTATLFGRRRIAILAAAFIAIDPMSYVMSRISMNDIFVATFIAAAYLVFWQIWSGRWARSAWWALPLVGVLIGLAAATKWVGFYALAGLWVLVLARSDLGRLVLVGVLALAVVVGAIGAPWPFLVVMLALLAVALAITWLRPIQLDLAEALTAIPASLAVLSGVGLAFVLAFGSVEGRSPGSAVEYLFGLLARGAQAGWPAWIMLGVAAALLAWRAWRSFREPRSDAVWFRPGEMAGFAWSWVGACLIVIPLTVYALTYVPYLQLGHDWAVGGGPGYGWSLDELHAQMFGYHFNLQAGHDSASPWWSWPMALKPTWFFSGSYEGDQLAVIYNGGNPILFWAGIPALAVCAVLAWKRRSLALVLVVAAFAFQYVPWIRIERATFAYHYLTAVIFAMIAVAYIVDELLRRPAWRDLAIGYLALVVVVGVLIFPLGSALPMPDWYINAARALPPWNFNFQFPDPPQGTREELLTLGGAKVMLGLLAAAAASVFAVAGRSWWERRADSAVAAPGPMPESG